jgi:hypothetical protein
MYCIPDIQARSARKSIIVPYVHVYKFTND